MVNKTKELEKTKAANNDLHRGSINSEHEEFLHPNMKNSILEQRASVTLEQKRKKFNTCKSCFRRFDELIVKPILIHNYDKILQSKKDEFLELFMTDAEDWEDAYAKQGEEGVDNSILRKTRAQRENSIYKRITMNARRQSNMNGILGGNSSKEQEKFNALMSPLTARRNSRQNTIRQQNQLKESAAQILAKKKTTSYQKSSSNISGKFQQIPEESTSLYNRNDSGISGSNATGHLTSKF
jgi:hypothetical protein